ncbi:MAG TPA: vWA domain-containing protein [Polyangiaceae bacterium]
MGRPRAGTTPYYKRRLCQPAEEIFMRFRPSHLPLVAFGLVCSATACGGGSDETHGIDDKGGGKGGKGAGGTIPIGGTGGTGGTIPVGGVGGAAAGGTGTGGSADCAKSTSSAMPAAPVLLFLVDTSASMGDPAPGGGGTKWVVTQGALNEAFGAMRGGTNVGLVFFPDVPTNTMPCFDNQIDVPIAALDAAQGTALSMQVTNEMPRGSTPTHDAYEYALAQLRAATLPGQKYVVLITDGVPTYARNCQGSGQPMQMPPTPTQPLIDASAMAMAEGIRTFVIGSPGSEGARESLSQMASQGGTARAGCSDTGPTYCHLDMTTEPNFSAALNAALDEVIAGIPLSCEFPLPAPPAGMELDRGKVNVTYVNGMMQSTDLGRDTSGQCSADGWDYTPDGTRIQLCGALCDQVKADPSASISIELGCSTRPVVL